MSHWFAPGDMPGFFGLHIIVAFAFFLMWLAIVAGLFVLLFFVIRIAVTRGILRADALRAAPARQVAPAHPAAQPTSTAYPPAPTTPDRPAPAQSAQPPASDRPATSADSNDPSI